MAPIQSSRHRQKGAVTLVITLLVMIALTIGSFALIQTGTTEKRMTANDQRSRTAFQAAQSGIDFLLAHLALANVNVEELCRLATWEASGFLLSFTGPDGSGDLDFDPATQSAACLATPFRMLQKSDVWSRGFSEDRESVRTLVSTIDLTSQWQWDYDAGDVTQSFEGAGAIIAGGTVQMAGNVDTGTCPTTEQCMELAQPGAGNRDGNREIVPNEILISAGGSVNLDGNAAEFDSTNWLENDPDLQNTNGEILFQEYVASQSDYAWADIGAYAADTDNVVTVVPGQRGTTTIGDAPLVYVDGDLTLRNGTIGGPDQSVLIVVNGDVDLAGNVIIWGTVLALGDADFSRGTNKIIGSLITPGNVDMAGNPAVYYNAGAAGDPIINLAQERDPDTPSQIVTLRVGSWREVAAQ
jgi:hypothetical protein